MPKQMCDIGKSTGISAGETNEEQRRWSDKQWENRMNNPQMNYDITRCSLNFEISGGRVQEIDTSETIDEKIRRMCRERGMRYPNDRNPRRKPDTDDSKVPKRNVAAQIMFGGDRERMHELAFGGYGIVDLRKGADNSSVRRHAEIEEWALDTYRFVADQWGEENIVSFYVHLDEVNPHCHVTVLPVAEIKGKQRISWNRVFGSRSKAEGKEKYEQIHTDYYNAVGVKWGLDRGDPISETGARHRSTREWREQVVMEAKQAEKAVKGLQTMISNLEDEKELLMVKVRNLGQLRGLQDEQFIAAKKQLEEVEAKLDDKRTKLATAEKQLDDLRGVRGTLVVELENLKKGEEQAKERVYNLNLQLARTASDNQGLAVSNVTAAFFSDIITDFGIRSNASPELREAGSDTLISQMVERSTDMITVAGLLYLGLPVQAVAYADSHGGGGGGGGSDLPWGRDPKEDDREWARRCAQEAKRMMASPKRQQDRGRGR